MGNQNPPETPTRLTGDPVDPTTPKRQTGSPLNPIFVLSAVPTPQAVRGEEPAQELAIPADPTTPSMC